MTTMTTAPRWAGWIAARLGNASLGVASVVVAPADPASSSGRLRALVGLLVRLRVKCCEAAH
jgi:hypothetical protein